MTAELSSRKATLDRRDLWILVITLAAALIHGLVYMFLMPPWQHYDEPKHFEVVWLVSRLNRMPRDEDANPALSRAVLESMVLNDFYGKGYTPDQFIKPDQPVYTPGISQYQEKPLYYFLASLPVRLLAGQTVETQLTSARFVSVHGHHDDLMLAEAIRNSSRVYLPMVLTNRREGLNDRDKEFLQRNAVGQVVQAGPAYRSVILPLDILTLAIT